MEIRGRSGIRKDENRDGELDGKDLKKEKRREYGELIEECIEKRKRKGI